MCYERSISINELIGNWYNEDQPIMIILTISLLLYLYIIMHVLPCNLNYLRVTNTLSKL